MSQQSNWSDQLIGVTPAGFFPRDTCNFTFTASLFARWPKLSWLSCFLFPGTTRASATTLCPVMWWFPAGQAGPSFAHSSPCVSPLRTSALTRPRPTQKALAPPASRYKASVCVTFGVCGTLHVYLKKGGGAVCVEWLPDRLRAAVVDSCGQRPVQWHSYVMCMYVTAKGGVQYEDERCAACQRQTPARCCCCCVMVTILKGLSCCFLNECFVFHFYWT